MEESIITWYVKEDDIFTSKDEFNAGAYSNKKPISVDLQVWNNRWGVNDVEDIESPVLTIYFDSYEDASLLKFCKVYINKGEELPMIIRDNQAHASISRVLSGKQNDGEEGKESNKKNYIDIHIEFDAGDSRLKENDLKKLFFEISSLD